MRNIDHHSQPVHFSNHLFPEFADSVVFGRSSITRRVTNIVVQRMTKCDVTNSQLVKFFNAGDIFGNRESVLHTNVYGPFPSLFYSGQVISFQGQRSPVSYT